MSEWPLRDLDTWDAIDGWLEISQIGSEEMIGHVALAVWFKRQLILDELYNKAKDEEGETERRVTLGNYKGESVWLRKVVTCMANRRQALTDKRIVYYLLGQYGL